MSPLLCASEIKRQILEVKNSRERRTGQEEFARVELGGEKAAGSVERFSGESEVDRDVTEAGIPVYRDRGTGAHNIWDPLWFTPEAAERSELVDHVDQLRAGFAVQSGRKCDTCKALEISTTWFGTRRSKVQILSPRPLLKPALNRVTPRLLLALRTLKLVLTLFNNDGFSYSGSVKSRPNLAAHSCRHWTLASNCLQ